MDEVTESHLNVLKMSDANRFKRRESAKVVEDKINDLEESKDYAYWERNVLISVLSKHYPSYLARHPEDDKEWEDDWRWIVFIDLPTGQVSWHIHDNELHLFEHLQEGVNEWDGHTNKQKYRRLKKLNPQAEKKK